MSTALATQPPVSVTNPTDAYIITAVQTFEGIQRLAELMAKVGTMPVHLQSKPADCFRIVVQAAKWRMDPFAVAECTSLVHGRMCYEGKLVAAVLQSMAAIQGRLQYNITGKGQDAEIVVTGTPRGSSEPVSITGSVKLWRTLGKDKAGNPMKNAWDTQPETQLIYRGTRQWARVYCPEAILGVYTPDEIDDEPRDVTATATVVPEPKPARRRSAQTVEQTADAAEQVAVEPNPGAERQGPRLMDQHQQPAAPAARATTPELDTLIGQCRKLFDAIGRPARDGIAAVCRELGVARVQDLAPAQVAEAQRLIDNLEGRLGEAAQPQDGG